MLNALEVELESDVEVNPLIELSPKIDSNPELHLHPERLLKSLIELVFVLLVLLRFLSCKIVFILFNPCILTEILSPQNVNTLIIRIVYVKVKTNYKKISFKQNHIFTILFERY